MRVHSEGRDTAQYVSMGKALSSEGNHSRWPMGSLEVYKWGHLQKPRWEQSVLSRAEKRGTSSTLSTTRHFCGVMLSHAWNTELRRSYQGV